MFGTTVLSLQPPALISSHPAGEALDSNTGVPLSGNGVRHFLQSLVCLLLFLIFTVQGFYQALDPVSGRYSFLFLATFDPRDLRGQEEGGESPGCGCGCFGLVLLQQPGALLTQSDEAFQLTGVDILADVQGGFEGVLDVQRDHLRLVLLFALGRGKGQCWQLKTHSRSGSSGLHVTVHLSCWSCFKVFASVCGACISERDTALQDSRWQGNKHGHHFYILT